MKRHQSKQPVRTDRIVRPPEQGRGALLGPLQAADDSHMECLPATSPDPTGPTGPTGSVPDGPDTPIYFTVPDAARELGLSERVLRKRLAQEGLPVLRPEGQKRGILVPADVVEILRRRPSPTLPTGPAGRTGPGPDGPDSSPSLLAIMEAKLEGAQTAARLHAQRRREEQAELRGRYQAEREREREERAKLEAQLSFLQERLVQAEQEGRELRLLMAQSVQAQQQTAKALEALRERPALPEARSAPRRTRWLFWRR